MFKIGKKAVCIAIIFPCECGLQSPVKKDDIVTVKEIKTLKSGDVVLGFEEHPDMWFFVRFFRPIDESERFAEDLLEKLKEEIMEEELIPVHSYCDDCDCKCEKCAFQYDQKCVACGGTGKEYGMKTIFKCGVCKGTGFYNGR